MLGRADLRPGRPFSTGSRTGDRAVSLTLRFLDAHNVLSCVPLSRARMSKTPGSEEESRATDGVASSDRAASPSSPPPVPADDSSVVPIAIDLPMVLADDEASSPAADDELLARDA